MPLLGATWMILAGISFAIVNTLTQYVSYKMQMPSTSVAFFQYFIALIFMSPMLLKMGGINLLKTKHFPTHLLRVFLSVIGVQLWIWALSYPVPIWQAIALVMISPLFATVGAGLFLGEHIGTARWLATIAGFFGAMLILEPWSDNFSWATLLPVGAAFFWACYSLMVKKLSHEDSPSTMTIYLLLLISPFNLVLALPEWTMPATHTVWLLLIATGACSAFANWAIANAYNVADASFVQPFDHAKLFFNVLAGWIVFGWVPPGRLWLGAAIIIGAVAFITQHEYKLSREQKS